MKLYEPFDEISQYQSESLRDLEIHNELMRQLSDCLKAMNDLMEQAKNVTGAVATHNIDDKAHEDIRRKLAAIGDISSDAIVDQISQHDISETSHASLRAKVNTIANQIASISATITSAINSHNTSNSAHTDIRAQVAALKNQIGDLNLANITEEIRKDLDKVTQELRKLITQIQSTIAQIQQTIQNQSQEIENLGDRVTQTNNKLTIIANNGSSQRTDVDNVVLRIAELKYLHDIIDAEENPNAPYEFTHTLSNIITPGKSKTFQVRVKLRGEELDQVQFKITPITPAEVATCTFSKTDEIPKDEVITITADEGNEPGTIYAFRVDAKDLTKEATITRVICVLMARPFQQGNISIDNFPGNVEPKHEYPVRVINLDDPGDGRFTYKMESNSEKVTFNPATAQTSPQFSLIVAEDQERDVDVRCTLTVHDTELDTDTVISEDTHINPLPDRDLFKHTVPPIVNPDATVQVQFYGVIAVDGTNATYKIKTKPDWLTFTPDKDIFANQNVAVKVQRDIARGTEGAIVVTSHDVNDVEFDYTINVKVNRLPSSAAITTTLPASNIGGRAVPFRISGGTDPDENTSKVTYSIDPGSSGLTFSKTSGITSEEDVSVTLPKVADDTPKTFTVWAVDSQGERSEDTKNVNTTITPIWVADPPRITAPTDGAEVAYEGYTVTWTEFTFHADVS